MSSDKFTWQAEDIEITPSLDAERYILAAAAVEGIEKAVSRDVLFFKKKGYLTDSFALTPSGEARLLELLKLAETQEEERFILALASVQGIEEAGPAVQKLINKGFINKNLSITNDGQRQLAYLSGLELESR